MRSLENAESSWSKFRSVYPSLGDVKSPSFVSEASSYGRSILWKFCLLFRSQEHTEWLRSLEVSRTRYRSLKSESNSQLQTSDELDAFADPLSEDPKSRWESLRRDETLRHEIFQDICRCMPDNLYFQQPETQTMMLDVLFVWSKQNNDVSYRQGMHEVLAPILWVLERDAVSHPSSSKLGKNDRSDAATMFDADYIEADSFTLFEVVMASLRSAYETEASSHNKAGNKANESPMLIRSQKIVQDDLRRVDPELSAHLISIELLPQVFLVRWIRLLFGREFTFDELLPMWDYLFVKDSTLQCVDLICVVLLLRLRWQLLESDHNTALTLLLKMPAQSAANRPVTLIEDALYLRDHLNFDGGYQVISTRTGQPPPLINRPTTPVKSTQFPLHQSTPQSEGRSRALLRNPRNSGGFEALLQDAARGLQQHGEKLGINKAVREAIGEVRKNVRDLQANRALHSRNNSGMDQTLDVSRLLRRIENLENRNKSVGRLLEAAVTDLWQQHGELAQAKASDSGSIEALALGIAKVQLAQVYLEDSSLALPSVDELSQTMGSKASEAVDTDAVAQSEKSQTDDDSVLSKENASPVRLTQPDNPSQSPTREDGGLSTKSPGSEKPGTVESPGRRPPLAQSAFSWMLGQGEPSSKTAFMSSSPFRDNRDRLAPLPNGTLFGEADHGKHNRRGSNASKSKDKGKSEKQKQGEESNDDDEFYSLRTIAKKPGASLESSGLL